MNKSEFSEFLRDNRKINFSGTDYNFRSPMLADTELMWRLFQSFPACWSPEDKLTGVTILIIHLVCSVKKLLEANYPRKELVDFLYQDLKNSADVLLGKKYLSHLIDTIEDLLKNNS